MPRAVLIPWGILSKKQGPPWASREGTKRDKGPEPRTSAQAETERPGQQGLGNTRWPTRKAWVIGLLNSDNEILTRGAEHSSRESWVSCHLKSGQTPNPQETCAPRKTDHHLWMGQTLDPASKVRHSKVGWRTNNRTQSQEMVHWGAHCRLWSPLGPNPGNGGVNAVSGMSTSHQEQHGKWVPTSLQGAFPSPYLIAQEE